MKTSPSAALFDQYATEYQSKHMDTQLYHDSFDRFCAAISTENAAILEVACGPGNITQYLLSQRPDFQILGTDLAPNMIALAKANNPAASFQLMDSRDIGLLDQKFDGIVSGFCFPYLSKEEVEKFVADAARILNPGGVLYISTMEDDYEKSGIRHSSKGDEMNMYFYPAAYLTKLLDANGFCLLDLQRKEYPAPDGTLTTDLLIVAGRQQPN